MRHGVDARDVYHVGYVRQLQRHLARRLMSKHGGKAKKAEPKKPMLNRGPKVKDKKAKSKH